MPVYFVSLSELQAAMADGVLTIGELETLPSLLRGTAEFYKQTVRNEGSGSGVIALQITARGVLEDGRAFQVETVVSGPDLRQNTRIVFR